MKIQKPELRASSAAQRGERSAFFILQSAFSLLEVMIAVTILFTATFAILELVSTTLKNARTLQQNEPDMGIVAGELSLTNTLTEHTESGNFEKMYPGYRWSRDVYCVGSNGMFEADFTISKRVGRQNVESHMSILLFRPQSLQATPRGEIP